MIKKDLQSIPDFLTPKTMKVFLSISENDLLKEFTLVGGSAIAYYLQHRLSEDLDFFTWNEGLSARSLDLFLKDISKQHKIIFLNQNKNELDIQVDGIKITLFANNWDELKKNRKNIYKNSHVASIALLTAMKINTLSLRAKFRDYYDLYVISRDVFNIDEIFQISQQRLPGLTKKIFAMQLSYTNDINDENITHLKPKYKISKDKIRIHFENLLTAFLKK